MASPFSGKYLFFKNARKRAPTEVPSSPNPPSVKKHVDDDVVVRQLIATEKVAKDLSDAVEKMESLSLFLDDRSEQCQECHSGYAAKLKDAKKSRVFKLGKDFEPCIKPTRDLIPVLEAGFPPVDVKAVAKKLDHGSQDTLYLREIAAGKAKKSIRKLNHLLTKALAESSKELEVYDQFTLFD